MKLRLGFSSCPNDTFMFAALVQGLIPHPLELKLTVADVEELNQMVLTKRLDVSKISCQLLSQIFLDYCLLPVGAAIGKGCGPLVVAKGNFDLANMTKARIAAPGRYTTAYALFRQFAPQVSLSQFIFTRFDRIMPLVKEGKADLGIIIHEGRFVYKELGLNCLIDLGEWWESQRHLPIPLGGIVAGRWLDNQTVNLFTDALKRSILFAYKHPEQVMPFVRRHACYLKEEVIQQHIDLYVNELSLNLGPEGVAAIEALINQKAQSWLCGGQK